MNRNRNRNVLVMFAACACGTCSHRAAVDGEKMRPTAVANVYIVQESANSYTMNGAANVLQEGALFCFLKYHAPICLPRKEISKALCLRCKGEFPPTGKQNQQQHNRLHRYELELNMHS